MSNPGKGGDLPLPIVIGVLVVVVLVIGGFVWHFVFQAPSNPLANLTTQQKIDRYEKISKEHPGKGNPFAPVDDKPQPK